MAPVTPGLHFSGLDRIGLGGEVFIVDVLQGPRTGENQSTLDSPAELALLGALKAWLHAASLPASPHSVRAPVRHGRTAQRFQMENAGGAVEQPGFISRHATDRHEFGLRCAPLPSVADRLRPQPRVNKRASPVSATR